MQVVMDQFQQHLASQILLPAATIKQNNLKRQLQALHKQAAAIHRQILPEQGKQAIIAHHKNMQSV
jgi:hypothetical protein